jgi:hypothetical protein
VGRSVCPRTPGRPRVRPSSTSADPVGHPGPGTRAGSDDARPFGGLAWTYQTPPLRALGFTFAIRSSSEIVGRYLHELLVAFEAEVAPSHTYSFVERPPGDRFDVYRDGEIVSSDASPSTALRHLLWDINREAIGSTPERLVFHASGVEQGGRAIVFPAPMGAGKTTLVAGMIQRGLRYLTDEAVAVDPTTLEVQPYPKPLSIETGSWDVLRRLRPDVHPSLEAFLEAGWYVPSATIRRDLVAAPCVPGAVIAPRYERGARSGCVAIRRSEALIVLAENSFNVTGFGAQRGMDVVARLVRSCRCYRLTIGDLDEACAIVLDVLADMVYPEIAA